REDPISKIRRHAGTVVVHRDPQQLLRAIDVGLNHDVRWPPAGDRRLERVTKQIAERLAQQHLVPFELAELADHLDVAAKRAHLGAYFLSAAFADSREAEP